MAENSQHLSKPIKVLQFKNVKHDNYLRFRIDEKNERFSLLVTDKKFYFCDFKEKVFYKVLNFLPETFKVSRNMYARKNHGFIDFMVLKNKIVIRKTDIIFEIHTAPAHPCARSTRPFMAKNEYKKVSN